MKHFPATRFPVRLEGLSVTRAHNRVPLATAVLIAATTFAAGFATAIWTIGMIVTRR